MRETPAETEKTAAGCECKLVGVVESAAAALGRIVFDWFGTMLDYYSLWLLDYLAQRPS